ncbi:MAG: 1-acyl-sn-glycerol-3-phosphate acyltransferase [Deltaproteobacteria bacterium]|nr:1-acyl-sn-glycerol-3-phosphate acyltransferase [Deltaproteobacteria bacterium]
MTTTNPSALFPWNDVPPLSSYELALGTSTPQLDEWLRARARLARFAAHTTAATAALAVRAALGRSSLGASARTAHHWAHTVIDSLGVDVRMLGPTPPRGSLIVANHRSYVDIAAVFAVSPAIFLAKVEIGGWPILGLGARIGHTIFVTREDAASRRAAVAAMRRVLAHGESVALFPEGTTSDAPGMLPFHPGSFRMAAEDGRRVVPIAIRYPHREDCWVGDESFVSHFLRRAGRREQRVSLVIGEPIESGDAHHLQNQAEDFILAHIGGKR